MEGINYDSQIDRYILPHHSIKYKHACYRNLLLSLGILIKIDHGIFSINDLSESLLAKENKKKLIISEETLLKKLEAQRLQGELGELFAMEYELKRLSLKQDKNKIKRISVLDVSAGYDIISYNEISSTSLDRCIEVKTYKGLPHFHWSSNEMKIARIKSKNYYLYLIDITKISNSTYEPFIICDPVSYFNESLDWISRPESYLFEKIKVI